MARHIILELKIVKIKKINIGDNLVDMMIKARPVVWTGLIFSVAKAESCEALRSIEGVGQRRFCYVLDISVDIFMPKQRFYCV